MIIGNRAVMYAIMKLELQFWMLLTQHLTPSNFMTHCNPSAFPNANFPTKHATEMEGLHAHKH